MLALIVVEVFLLALFISPIFVDNRSAATALMQWREKPTAETEAKWLSAQKKSQRERAAIRGIVGVLLVTNAAGITFLGMRLKVKTP
jgi:hypothetical protein